MDVKPIKSKRDYEAALHAIESLMRAKRNTAEGDRLEVLVTLVEAYERRHFPLDLPDPVEAIKFMMEQRNLKARDLVPYALDLAGIRAGAVVRPDLSNADLPCTAGTPQAHVIYQQGPPSCTTVLLVAQAR
jgi:hypothetical protein